MLKRLIEIANKFNIKIIQVEKGDKYCQLNGEDCYLNRSYIVGSDLIYLGIYEDESLLVASFFHEIGHIYGSTNNQVNSEEKAWEIGFKLMNKYGFVVDDNIKNWAKKQLKTYGI